MLKKGMKCICLLVVMVTAGLITTTLTVDADSNESAYSVSANLPDFQLDKTRSYFDFLLQAGQQKDFSIHLANSSTKKAVYVIDVNNATTNSNGVIDYGQVDAKKDSSANYRINELVTPKKQEVALAAGEAKDIAFHLKMPSQSFSGILLGGIHVAKKDSTSEKVDGTAIRNKYAYVIGVKIENSTDEITPNLTLLCARAGLQNSYATVFAKVQNPTPTIISKTSFDARIKKKGSSKLLYETKKENLSIAPNTNFDFPIPLNKEKMAPGKYTVTIDAKEGNTNKTWHLSTDFEIKASKAKKLNQEAIIDDTSYSYLPVVIGIGILLLVIIFLLSYKLFKQKGR